MGHLINSYVHGGFHMPQNISTRITKSLQADHPLTLAFLSAGVAIFTYQLFAQYSPEGIALAALAGTSAWLLFVFAIESTHLTTILFNLLAAPLVFALAYASLSGPESFLIAAFAVQAVVIANQMIGAESSLKKGLYCWTLFNASLVLLLL